MVKTNFYIVFFAFFAFMTPIDEVTYSSQENVLHLEFSSNGANRFFCFISQSYEEYFFIKGITDANNRSVILYYLKKGMYFKGCFYWFLYLELESRHELLQVEYCIGRHGFLYAELHFQYSHNLPHQINIVSILRPNDYTYDFFVENEEIQAEIHNGGFYFIYYDHISDKFAFFSRVSYVTDKRLLRLHIIFLEEPLNEIAIICIKDKVYTSQFIKIYNYTKV